MGWNEIGPNYVGMGLERKKNDQIMWNGIVVFFIYSDMGLEWKRNRTNKTWNGMVYIFLLRDGIGMEAKEHFPVQRSIHF